MAIVKETSVTGGSKKTPTPPVVPGSSLGKTPISDTTRGTWIPTKKAKVTTPVVASTGLKAEVRQEPIVQAPASTYETGGGGGGSSGGSSGTSTTAYAGLPTGYTTAMTGILGDMATYYTTERGGEDQAKTDYNNMLSFWYNRTGRPMMTEDVNNITSAFAGYAKLLGRTTVMGDLFTFLDKYLSKAPTPPQVSYSRVGEF